MNAYEENLAGRKRKERDREGFVRGMWRICMTAFSCYIYLYIQMVHICSMHSAIPRNSVCRYKACSNSSKISIRLRFSALLLPRRVPTSGAPRLPFLEQTLSPPLTPLRIHIPRRLHRNAGSRPLCGNLLPLTALQLWHIDMLAGIKLERGLRARDVEVEVRGGVGHADEGAQG